MRKRGIYLRISLGIMAGGIVLLVLVMVQSRTVNIEEVLAAYKPEAEYEGLTIHYPLDGTLFPQEIVPPTFRWEDDKSKAWLITIKFSDDKGPLNYITRRVKWVPEPETWEGIKRRSLEKWADITIMGVARSKQVRILSEGRLKIKTSKDEIGAPLFYREVNLPFVDAVMDPSHIRWRFGSISSPKPPPVILTNLPVCGNCHSFTRDGKTLAMDVDYANSKGSYVITRVAKEMVLATSDIITWNDYKKEDGEQTFGLLSQMSPDGRYVVSTVKDKSVFVPKPGLAFSQLFFPIKGILCIYDRQEQRFFSLFGADDPKYVQSNPSWSPDGKYIVFARSEAYKLKHTQGLGKVLLTPEDCKEFLEEGKLFLFDLYRIPFNEGRGGIAEPIEGASNNGMSNFFARYSPEGRWIVFCKAKSYMLLQPDSELYIIPAEGGQARRLECNTSRMNSWHSWSPNGKWLVFSSKVNSDYTELFLTHIDEDGRSSPAVSLSYLTSPDRAVNIPEFVNCEPTAIVKIKEQFLNDYSFVRAGNEFYKHGKPDDAIEEYNNALELNPTNVEAHQKLGFLWYHVKGEYEQGIQHMMTALRLDPFNVKAHHDIGMALLYQQKIDQAIAHLSEALRLAPRGINKQYNAVDMNYQLGRALHLKGDLPAACTYLGNAVQLDPNNAEVHYTLAVVLAEQGKMDETFKHYSTAMRLNPKVDNSAALHYLLSVHYAKKGRFNEAILSAQTALKLAQASGEHEVAAKIKQLIELYKQRLGKRR